MAQAKRNNSTTTATAEQPALRTVSQEIQEQQEFFTRALAEAARQTPQPSSSRLDPSFTVNVNQPLPQFSTTLTKAYETIDANHPGLKLYALVCNPHMPIRSKVIKALQGVAVPGLVTLHAAGLTDLNGISGRRMVLIYDQPQGKSLHDIMIERGNKPVADTYILEHILKPIANVLVQFAELGICHGRINPQNLYLSDNSFTMGECAAEPCGYSQPYQFEPPSRIQCHPAGKGETTTADDVFAVGLLAAWLRTGQKIFNKTPDQNSYLQRSLQMGTYSAFIQGTEYSDMMFDLLRGALIERPEERWTPAHLRSWARGRRYNMITPNQPAVTTRPVILESKEYATLRHLSQGMAEHQEAARAQLRDGTIIRWLDFSARRKDLVEIMRRAIISLGSTTARNTQQNDELVSRAITILDPQAPLTMKNSRAHLTGIGCLLAEASRQGDNSTIDNTLKIMETGLPVVWADMYKRRDEDITHEMSNTLWLLDRMRMVLRLAGYVFGMERCLYDMNPDLPCQSPLLEDNHAASLKELLLTLDRIAPQKAATHRPLDRHIGGFIGAKLALTREPHLAHFQNIAAMSNSPALIALRALEQAYNSSGKPKVSALTCWLALEIVKVSNNIHSRTIREKLYQGLQQIAPTGNLQQLSNFVNQHMFAELDQHGYRDSVLLYVKARDEMYRLRHKPLLKRRASIAGYAIAKSIANVILAVSLVYYLQLLLF